MSVYMMESYVVHPEKLDRLEALLTKCVSLLKSKPEKFKGVKSYQALHPMVGDFSSCIEIWEFESMNDIETFFKTLFSDEELKKIPQEFFTLIEPGSHRSQVLTSMAAYKPQKLEGRA